ncbi:MAG: acetyl-CoA carboxylase biotin carboxyl carrier protein [Gemmatimonadales bacterium]|nr:acetyl-CoA carboxylase biotin carboxyl carrier protein [Gemmatimonadota bacterium]MCC7133466.1 acetyl-CoA carboxylase biotin carboxyl carrier protein [Gemmatimonadales bacterium]MDX2057772.1 acetyl-CoA carboxylase biotin carboxyl carrier protein [Gemmatimonadales bacterium]
MNPEEIKALAEVIDKVPGVKGIEFKDVRRLAELLRESPEIGSIELKGWFGTGVVITRTSGGPFLAPPMLPPPMPMMAGAPVAPAAPQAGAAAPADPPKPAVALKEIKSPMVGTFYAAPEPGAEPYAKVGTRVTPGRTVCIIEAMKIMNEIEAEFGGVVREVCVEDAQPVEFGQVLYRIDPNG